MASRFSSLLEDARLAARAIQDFSSHLVTPTVRLGVTGLSRAGKTVFITAVVHGLTRGGRFPVFESLATGRIEGARLEPQPDDAVPRFAYENHLRALVEERRWPSSTTDISELHLVIDYQSTNRAQRELTLDIVDYPGEWLLDLPLLEKSYEQWAGESLALSRQQPRARLASDWPFFRDHFARLDRQVVLVDALGAFNAGPDALKDLEAAMAAILECFRVGRRTLVSSLIRPRIDRILFAATKADHLHRVSHDRLEAVLKHLMRDATARAGSTGALTDAVAIAAVRATREAE